MDPDGDPLTFGVRDYPGSDVIRIENLGTSEANVFLNKELDREVCCFFSPKHLPHFLTLKLFVKIYFRARFRLCIGSEVQPELGWPTV